MSSPGSMGLHQLSRPVTDVDRAVDFYNRVLGVPLVGRFGPLAFLDLDGTRLMIQATDRHVDDGVAIYFAVEDITAARDRLVERGVEFLDEPHLVHRDDEGLFGPTGNEEWMTFFRDPDGNLLALSTQRTVD